MSRRSIVDLINNSAKELPANRKFQSDVMSAIERVDLLSQRKGSNFYKPSSLACLRNMYFTRIGAEQDNTTSSYQGIGMADTGTRRHEAIQDVLLQLKDLGYDWEYLDVAEYVLAKQAEGKCQSIEILEKCGAETHLRDNFLHTSFRVDGVVRRISTNEYFLFEFKNQTSFKYRGKQMVDPEHVMQVTCYCQSLDLNKALVLYENRDVCELICPEVFEVTDVMKQELCVDRILECESYVERLEVPPKPLDEKKAKCQWCSYTHECRKAGRYGKI